MINRYWFTSSVARLPAYTIYATCLCLYSTRSLYAAYFSILIKRCFFRGVFSRAGCFFPVRVSLSGCPLASLFGLLRGCPAMPYPCFPLFGHPPPSRCACLVLCEASVTSTYVCGQYVKELKNYTANIGLFFGISKEFLNFFLNFFVNCLKILYQRGFQE